MPVFRKQAFGLIAGLIIQFILGMVINLYIQFPESVPEAQLWEFARSQVLIIAHIVLGLMLFLSSAIFAFRSIKQEDKTWKLAGGFGILAIIGAILTGERFVSTQEEIYSFAMALCFGLAIISYVGGIYLSKND